LWVTQQKTGNFNRFLHSDQMQIELFANRCYP
jgi:hypothetical protein